MHFSVSVSVFIVSVSEEPFLFHSTPALIHTHERGGGGMELGGYVASMEILMHLLSVSSENVFCGINGRNQ